MYHEGEILSPDGYCRAFDERSAGTVLTSGAGVVALRRLADALDDGDPILAVIKGTAINNDGQRKVGYLAPSVDGHADVVKEALAVAGLSARDIQLLEAHGTGTAVGDPIEVAALTEAFRASTADTRLLPARVDEAEHRPPRHRRRRGQPDQGRPGAAPPHAAAARQPHRARARCSTSSASPFVISTEASAVAGRPARAGPASARSASAAPTPTSIVAGGAGPRADAAGRARAGARALRPRRRTPSTTARRASPTSSRPTPTPTSPTSPTRWPRAAAPWPTAASSPRPTSPTAIEVLRSNDRNRVATSVAAGRSAAGRVHVPGRRLAVQRHGRRPRRALRRVPRGDAPTASTGSGSRSGVDLAPLLRPDADQRRAARDRPRRCRRSS